MANRASTGPVEIHRGRRHVVVRLEDDAGHSLIRKTPRPRAWLRDAPGRLRHEFDILRLLDESGVPHVTHALALDDAEGQPTLVLADAGPRNLGERLRRRALPVETFFDIAIQLTEAVAGLHQHRVIHRDINPSNVVVAEDGHAVTLVDFGLATHVVAMVPVVTAGELATTLAGTLAYIAPEQTGRVDRALDHRADLYALGATFYEMLTGGPPFQCQDPAELIHAHLAWTPVPPHVRHPSVPETLSEIVLRLLAKMPEQRYQSAAALLSDLRQARAAWTTTGTIAPFELGRADAPRDLLSGPSFAGRATELATLTAAVDRARTGACQLVVLSGAAGIGKSRLIEALHAARDDRARFVFCKADVLRGNLPYGAFGPGLRTFLRALLREPVHLVDQWRMRLTDALGSNASVLTDFLPELLPLIGEPLPAPPVGPLAAENRFRHTLQRLVEALGDGDRPVVLCLDDLQWADGSSLALIERLVTAPDAHHSCVLGAWRAEPGEQVPGREALLAAARAAGASTNSLALGPLDEAALAALCAGTLGVPEAEVRPLTALVLRKTAGNPFFVERFLHLLHRSNLLTYDRARRGWRWDLAAGDALDVTDNVVGLMVSAVEKLPDETIELLKVAACMRDRIDLDLLAAVVGAPAETTARQLWSALRDGLLLPERTERSPSASYRFVHDRVRQAAYDLLDDAGRQRVHLAIGRQLLTAAPHGGDAQLFDVVDQLGRGVALMTDEAERLRFAELSLRVAQRARLTGSLGPALEYARQGIAALPSATRETHRPLWLALHREATECAFSNGNGGLGVALFNEALGHAVTAFEKADLHGTRVTGEGMRTAQREACLWGRAGLAVLNYALPEEISSEVIAREKAAVKENLLARSGTTDAKPLDPMDLLIDLPPMREPRALAILDLLRRMALPARACDDALWNLVVLRIVRLSLEFGNAATSAYGYVGYSMLLLDEPDDASSSQAFRQAGVELARRLQDPSTEAWVLTTCAVLANHWQAPLRASLPLLRRAVPAAIEAGEFQMAGFAVGGLVSHLFHSGVELAQVDSECTAGLRFMQKTGQTALASLVQPYRDAIVRLQLSRREPRDINDSPPGDGTRTAVPEVAPYMRNHAMGLVAQYLMRDRDQAAQCFANRQQLFNFAANIRRSTAMNWLTYYTGLTAAFLFDAASADERETLRAELGTRHGLLDGWARRCPENMLHHERLVAAEMARIDGRALEGLPLYDQAIEGARAGSFLQDEALAYELAARCRLALGLEQTAAAYLQNARAAYARWGAAAKVEALDDEFPRLLQETPSPGGSSSVPGDDSAAALDLLSLRKASDTLSGEVVLDRLLEKLIAVCLEVAGARRGVLVLEQEGELAVRAQGSVFSPVLLSPTALAASEQAPRTLVEHVFASGQAVVLADAAHHGPFTGDPYIAAREVKSALAMPILQHGRSLGVLYLENDLATHGFPPERVRILALLSSQMAISLENSLLFEHLRVEVRDRTRAEKAVGFLADASAALAESLDYRTTLAEVAQLAVPFLADWCTVDIVEKPDQGQGKGCLVPVAETHVDPAKEALLRELRSQRPIVEEQYMMGLAALRTGAPVIIPQVDEERMAAAVNNPAHLELLQRIGVRSVLSVPLVARGRGLGAITLAHATSTRRYEPGDVALVQELARRAAIAVDNARLYQQAQDAIRLRDEFLTAASHELNTPIATLSLSVSAFTSGTPLPPPETLFRLMGHIERQTDRLNALVSEMLDVSAVQAGVYQVHLEPVELTALIRRTAARLEPQRVQAQCPLVLDLGDGAEVQGLWDRKALERVVFNLLGNAIKFGPGKPIELRLTVEPTAARLTVRDHGIGIGAAELPRIFDRFTRAVPIDNYGGLGLGLYLTREILTALGGSISVDSAPGQGSTFTVELPYPDRALPRDRQDSGPAGTSRMPDRTG